MWTTWLSTSISRDFNWPQHRSCRQSSSHALRLIHFVLRWRLNVDDGGRRIRRSSGWFGSGAATAASLVFLAAAALPGGFPRRTPGHPSPCQHQGGTRGRPCLQSGDRGRQAARTWASSRLPGTHGRHAPMLGWRGAGWERTAAQRQILPAERVGEPVLRGFNYPRYWEHPGKKTDAVTDLWLDGPLCALFQG